MTMKRGKPKAASAKARPRKATKDRASTALSRALTQAARAALAVHQARSRQPEAPGPGVKRSSLRAPAGGPTAVTFTCNNFPTVLVSISTHAGSAVLQPGATFHLPSGDHPMAWAARGTAGAPFQVGVAGGTLNMPIGGILPAGGNGGPRILTVP